MSLKALRWAFEQDPGSSPAKLVLLALANHVRAKADDWIVWPGIAAIAESTCMDRKTVVANLGRLIGAELIADTGRRVGKTKQGIVYRLNGPRSGTVEASQKRNGTESGTVPLFPSKSTEFPSKEYRFSPERVPKPVHGIRKSNRGKATREKQPGNTTDEKRGSRIPEKWKPDDALRAWTQQEFPGLDIDRAVSEFVDYWRGVPGAKGRRTDWNGAWRNRVRALKDRQPARRKPSVASDFSKTTYQGTPENELPDDLR